MLGKPATTKIGRFFVKSLKILLNGFPLTPDPTQGCPRVNLSDPRWKNKISIIFLAFTAPMSAKIDVFPFTFDMSPQTSG